MRVHVNRTVVYHLAMGLVGLSFGAVALHTLFESGVSVASAALVVGGVAFVGQTVYFVAFTDSWRGDHSRWTVWLAVVAAVLSVAGAALTLAP